MIELTLSSPQLQFTQFLLERFGIEGNMLTVDEARAATRNGSAWNVVFIRLWVVCKYCTVHSEKGRDTRETHFKKRKRMNRRGICPSGKEPSGGLQVLHTVKREEHLNRNRKSLKRKRKKRDRKRKKEKKVPSRKKKKTIQHHQKKRKNVCLPTSTERVRRPQRERA